MVNAPGQCQVGNEIPPGSDSVESGKFWGLFLEKSAHHIKRVEASVLDAEITRLRNTTFGKLSFPRVVEACLEQDTAKSRSYRLWLEGLVAILVMNLCLVADFALVADGTWRRVLLRTLIVTPPALLVNALMRLNPPRRVREGSVAAGTLLICVLNLCAVGSSTPARSVLGMMCVLLMMLFAGLVMRIRFPYAVASGSLMFVCGIAFVSLASGLHASEKVIGASLLALGLWMTLTASYSMEREERLGYLLKLRGEMQGDELISMNRELERLSNLDTLTGLPNRRCFEQRFDALWADGMVRRTPLCVMVIDVDRFKKLNDVYGHLYGDDVLRRIGRLLTEALRGPEDFASRFGGEEFVVLLPETDESQAMLVAERIRGLVETAEMTGLERRSGMPKLQVTVSCGIAGCIPGAAMSKEKLLSAADDAMYEAKVRGRNRVVVEDGETAAQVV